MLIFISITSLKPQPSNSQTQYNELRANVEVKLLIDYNLVLTLNKNGVDVSYYANILNLSLDLLEKAGTYNNAGDDKNAISTLQLAASSLNNINNEAQNALTQYYSKGYLTYISNSIVPIVTTIIIVILTTLFWIIYKQYYLTKLMKMKPEVIKHEI
jgi:hypothetical protein